MELAVMPPLGPMLARAVRTIPAGMHYEAKWDGFRAIIFRDGDEVEIGSRNEKPLTRYFPEVVEAAKQHLPQRCVIDGEIIISTNGHLNFDALLNRIHPADSRVQMLARQTPASFVGFDLLALGDDNLMGEDFGDRRKALAGVFKSAGPPMHITPATLDEAEAADWFTTLEGAGLDGVIAKSLAGPYQPNKRVMLKIKHERTADCVVAGFRWHKSGPIVGSLLLGLFDDDGKLHHVGVAASFTMDRRRQLVDELAPYRLKGDELAEHPWNWGASQAAEGRVPGGQTRWNAGKDLSFELLRPELVVEVSYDAMQGDRFRHTAQFRNWRPDRTAASCKYDQLDRPISMTLADILG